MLCNRERILFFELIVLLDAMIRTTETIFRVARGTTTQCLSVVFWQRRHLECENSAKNGDYDTW